MEGLKGIESGYPEEYREKYWAALCVASLKHEKLSTETAMALHGLKTSIYFPPDIPPVACLNGLIGRCCKPFEKQLTESDVKVSQCRLSINKFNVENAVMPLLKEEEDSSESL
ncbi:hypothetical protein CRYUN_Cryun02cG0009200 [Craigia yunnanensis]